MYKASVSFFKDKKAKQAIEVSQCDSALVLAAYELHTPDNAGALIRLAGTLGISQVCLVYDKTFELRRAKIERVAQSSLSHVTYTIMNSSQFFQTYANHHIVALETSSKSTNLFSTTLPARSVLLAGNERFGLPNALLSHCQSSVFIPLPGQTASMNVSHAMTIAAFEWVRQHRAASLEM